MYTCLQCGSLQVLGLDTQIHTEGKSLAGEKVRKEFNKKTGLTALTDEV